MKYHIITFGCQMNKSDSERIVSVLEKIGYKKTSKIDEADLILVNMCSVRQSAVDRVYGLKQKFEKLKTENKKLKTILTGCILKKDRRKFAGYFNYILGIKDLAGWQALLCSQNGVKQSTIVGKITPHEYYLKIKPRYSSFPIGYVPISTGCNNFCAYCVVPYTRGPEICRSAKEIISEVKNLINRGYKEIWLLGQNVNSYGVQRKTTQNATQNYAEINFPKLLKMVNNIRGDFWVRFTSSHPRDFSDELIKTMAECQKLTPYLNLPVQSGDDEILKKMNRNYTARDYINLIKKIRKKIPDIALSTDIVVGFPGESEGQFQNTVKLFKEVKFDMAYISQYSPRWGTTASKMEDNVPKEEKKEREKNLTEILKKTALEKNKKYVGKILEVLPIKQKNEFLIGKSFYYKTVKFKENKNLIGKFVDIKIIDAQPWGLKGILIKKKCL